MIGKIKQFLPNILIVAGASLLVTFAVYEGIQYPWKQLFSQWGWIELPDELPDPAPLPNKALDTNAPMPSAQHDQNVMAMEGDLLTPRPNMNLTQLGVIKIPKIEISENIVEGSGSEMLYAVGHMRGSNLPGEEGNCILAAHRLYVHMRPFRYLDKVEIGDPVYIEDDKNTYTYEAFKIFEITPSDTWILGPQEEEDHLLTLLTCTPVVNPTRRLIVWCKLVDSTAKE